MMTCECLERMFFSQQAASFKTRSSEAAMVLIVSRTLLGIARTLRRMPTPESAFGGGVRITVADSGVKLNLYARNAVD